MSLTYLTFLMYFFYYIAEGYNLDINFPLIYHSVDEVEGPSSYFGMSVAIRPTAAENADSWVLQVGAPRKKIKSLKIYQSGTIYRCHLYGPCRLFLLDKTLGKLDGVRQFSHIGKEDGVWIGSSMDMESANGEEKSVVCGNRWVNQYLKNPENIDVTYLMTGICYLQDLYNETYKTEVVKLLPLVNSDKIYTPKPYVVNLSTYHWGLGQAGTSVSFVKNTSDILTGAPGVTHWIGSVIWYSKSLDVSVGDFTTTDIPKKNRYTYIGYSVAAGKFYDDKELWFVAGAPRSFNYKGGVYTFQFKDSKGKIYIQTTLKGNSFGEYFGSSITAEDVNNDGVDDLIVGAPLFSKKYPDEGRIYVYLGTKKGKFFRQAQVINGQINRGRFGTCVASVKDIDQDGFNDIVVGSPYEDENRGTIYIYRGYSLGLQAKYMQRIKASQLNPYLRGFGISFSRAIDIDGNKYNDIGIGSYLSGHVVVLRSRPIIFLQSHILYDDKSSLALKASYLNISFCSSFTSSQSLPYVDINRVIVIDPLFNRGSLRYPECKSDEKTLRLKTGKVSCEKCTVLLHLSEKNYSPFKVILKNELPPCSGSSKKSLVIEDQMVKEEDGFLKWCPVGKDTQVTKEIPFSKICGTDSVCSTDIAISCVVPEFQTGFYVLGSSEFFQLIIKLVNSGEQALGIKLKIWANANLFLKKKDETERTSSMQPIQMTFWQDIEEFFSDNIQANFSLKLPLDTIKELETKNMKNPELQLNAEVFISNIDTNLENNKCQLSVQIISDTHVNFYSSSSHSSFFIPEKITEKQLSVMHYYEIEKKGITPLLESELTIYFPEYFLGHYVSYEVDASEWINVMPNEKQYFSSKDQKNRTLEKASEKHSLMETASFPLCLQPNNMCHVLKANFPYGIPNEPPSYVRITTFLNITDHGVTQDVNGKMNFTFAFLRYKPLLRSSTIELQRSTSFAWLREEHKKINYYVIVLSVLLGAIILFALLYLLAKRNFFKRNKKHELEILKSEELYGACFSSDFISFKPSK